MAADASAWKLGSPPSVKAVGLIAKRTQAVASDVVQQVHHVLRERGIKVLLDTESARHLGRPADGLDPKAMVGHVDVAACLGGDGTFLSVARVFAASGTPIVGVNLGHLGFLTEVEPGEFADFFDRLLAGGCTVADRMMLEVANVGMDDERSPSEVLNDVVIAKAALARMLNFELSVDGVFVTQYRGDGLIISTPTGSTAYSLAAGGPIILPVMDAIVISPICPHALSQRPLIVPATSRVGISLAAGHDGVFLSLDGQLGYPVVGSAEFVVRRSAHVTRIVHDPEVTFFQLLRAKLGWGQR